MACSYVVLRSSLSSGGEAAIASRNATLFAAFSVRRGRVNKTMFRMGNATEEQSCVTWQGTSGNLCGVWGMVSARHAARLFAPSALTFHSEKA